MHALATVLLSVFVRSDATLDGGGGFVVRINEQGVLTGVPPKGLHPDLGPRILIPAGFHEWWAVDFMDGSRHASGAASGDAPDWGGRPPVTPREFSKSPSRVVAVTTLPDLTITHDYSFDPTTGKLLVSVLFENVGPSTIAGLFYTREWEIPRSKGQTWPPETASMLPVPPSDVWRIAVMPNNILPGRTQGFAMTFDIDRVSANAVDVPLRVWTNGTWPNGVDFGPAFGICFADWDHDGWIDVFVSHSGDLWHNEQGVDWSHTGNLNSVIGNSGYRYSAALADYDNDQLLDIGTEPRNGGDNCMHLLHNLGSASFKDVAPDPNIVDVQPCASDSETLCIADTDGDGNLDWFLPTYPSWMGSPGNWFLENLGPIGAGGAYTFHEDSAAAGLDNPAGVNRPEGAEFCDVDRDGDVDAYSNGTLYRNIVTQVGTPLFEPMSETGTGIVFSSILDEGCGFLDYDLDGDMDLLVSFCDARYGVRMFESRGDGTFFITPKTVFDSYNTGLCFGLSFEDWDNDGDIDVTSTEVFRRNQYMETGLRHFTVATHNLNPNLIADATPAWGDFDRDGDMDAAIGCLSAGYLFENTSWDVNTPMDQRRFVRVKPVRDDATHQDGLESEQGAQIHVDVLGNSDDGHRRTKVVTASGGYLNQPEYAVRVAVPADPDPSNPDVDLDFSVAVDFKNPSNLGFTRVDRHVNPILGDVPLAFLDDREIVVHRGGIVHLNGVDFVPTIATRPLTTTTDGLVLAGVNTPLPAPAPAPGSDWFVGIELSTASATAPQRVEQIMFDGQLAPAYDCSGTKANLFAWDVTVPSAPVLVNGGMLSLKTKIRNDRSLLPVDLTLEPNHLYRIVATVTTLRDTPILGPVVNGVITTNGGLTFQETTPCTGAGAAAALLDPTHVYFAVRFRDEPEGAWGDLGHSLAGTSGAPVLTGSGELVLGTATSIDLVNGPPNAPLWFIVGTRSAELPFAGGEIVPSLDLILGGLTTDASGAFSLSGSWPAAIPGGSTFLFQALMADPGAPKGFAISNAVEGVAAY